MDDLARTLRGSQDGRVSSLVLADILMLAESEGILYCIRKSSPCSLEGLGAILQSDLGYVLDKGNRRRMICLLLNLLHETGQVKRERDRWRWESDAMPRLGGSGCETSQGLFDGRRGSEQAERDDQYLFFQRCLESVPAYLRGGDSSLRFDDRDAGTWERFLGCAEFRSCRALLLELLALDGYAAPRVLDLCHGPGWGLEAVLSRFPNARVTALDFTDSFREAARARAERTQERNRHEGRRAPITWVGAERWKGFGDPLPFPDRVFDVVLFSGGDPYIPRHIRDLVYRDVARIVVPGGKLGVLTRCRPDAARRHMSSFWLRISALAHDFAESVCAGWEGFAEAEENHRLFAEAGFRGAVAPSSSMSVLDSSLWVLERVGASA
jgi:SAM-dependent methyltransferase